MLILPNRPSRQSGCVRTVAAPQHIDVLTNELQLRTLDSPTSGFQFKWVGLVHLLNQVLYGSDDAVGPDAVETVDRFDIAGLAELTHADVPASTRLMLARTARGWGVRRIP